MSRSDLPLSRGWGFQGFPSCRGRAAFRQAGSPPPGGEVAGVRAGLVPVLSGSRGRGRGRGRGCRWPGVAVAAGGGSASGCGVRAGVFGRVAGLRSTGRRGPGRAGSGGGFQGRGAGCRWLVAVCRLRPRGRWPGGGVRQRPEDAARPGARPAHTAPASGRSPGKAAIAPGCSPGEAAAASGRLPGKAAGCVPAAPRGRRWPCPVLCPSAHVPVRAGLLRVLRGAGGGLLCPDRSWRGRWCRRARLPAGLGGCAGAGRGLCCAGPAGRGLLSATVRPGPPVVPVVSSCRTAVPWSRPARCRGAGCGPSGGVWGGVDRAGGVGVIRRGPGGGAGG
ncbi:hypothetical protein FHS40_007075 [Streptomyces spectabilis]|uniref:Uncharacterized protein n=1 Tax=Streptomyces spectabilis TaxID=68270 RepID=A0A7W8EYC1_STRST|nr:hypothetical protein [Streptomyces spectabilis]